MKNNLQKQINFLEDKENEFSHLHDYI